jgi:cytochrome c-type biogenesis protein CcmF
MNILGNFFVAFALLFSILCSVLGFFGAAVQRQSFQEAARRGAITAGFFCIAALVLLAYQFLTDDYQNHYVWQFSNREMLPIYKITAVWGGMNGSMLFWGSLLSIFSAALAIKHSIFPNKLFSYALPTQTLAQIFFLGTVFFLTNPFEWIKADFIPPNGNGLNPLLQNPYMAVHPPMLYAGFTLFSVPFAFCIAALLANRLGNEWIYITRRWSIAAWMVLSSGIVMGGFWAYIELGWGGFWAWDPVENASFFPWLTGTAFLHSALIQERKGMLKTWNVVLLSLTYFLTIFGTFLTRSGIVQSVHAFASTNVGGVFLGYLIVMFIGVSYLIWKRRLALTSTRQLESIFSRESAFLLNNLIFLSICFATIWGVMFPVLSEAVTGSKQTVSAPFFNQVNIPLFMLMLFLMGTGTLIAWRKASWHSLQRQFQTPFLLSFGIAGLLVWAGITSFWAIVSYSLCFFVFLTIMGELYRGIKTKQQIFRSHLRRYAGYLVHCGVLVMVIGITASMAHKVEKEFTLKRGETLSIGRFNLLLQDFYQKPSGNFEALVSQVALLRANDQTLVETLKPEIRFYPQKNETTSEVALHVGLREDVYLVLAGISDDETTVSFKLFINPLQIWLWIGAIIMVLGGGLVLYSAKPKSH